MLQDAHSCEGCRINATSLRRAQGPPCFFGRRFQRGQRGRWCFSWEKSGVQLLRRNSAMGSSWGCPFMFIHERVYSCSPILWRLAVTVAHSGNIRNERRNPLKVKHVAVGSQDSPRKEFKLCVFFCLSSLHFDFSLSSETLIPPPKKKTMPFFWQAPSPAVAEMIKRLGGARNSATANHWVSWMAPVTLDALEIRFSKNVTKQSYGKIEQHLTQTYACQSLVVSKTFKQEGSDCAIEENRFVQPTLKYIYI